VLDKDGVSFDRIKTGSAEFNQKDGTLYADGDVEIITGEPVGDAATNRRQVHVRTSGLTFESKTQRASTDRPASFVFDQGEGKSLGAWYDPNTRELCMRAESEVTWRGQSPRSAPMTIQAGEIMYKERDSAILLSPWSRLKRGSLEMEGGRSAAYLNDSMIRKVEARDLRGSDRPKTGRQLEFAAQVLFMELSEDGEVQRLQALDNAQLVSVDARERTSVSAGRLELEFDVSKQESMLRLAHAQVNAMVESRQIPAAGAPQRETRILRSEIIDLHMRPGGKEIDSVETQTPGVVEFLPNMPTGRRRRMEADKITVAYGPKNEPRSLKAVNVATRTEFPKPPKVPTPPVLLTWSKELSADFDPDRGDVASMLQRGDFRFEQGDRRGNSESAVLDSKKNLITLQGNAHTSQPAGSLAADRISTDQEKGDVTAEGNVRSTHEPAKSKKPAAVISDSQPFNVRAGRMFAPGARKLIRYEDNVVLWQGGNRIEAPWVEIDRDKRTLAAHGGVRSEFVEAPAAGAKKRGLVTTRVRAAELFYTDETRTALYSGGVTLDRGGINVVSSQLRAVFAVKDGATNLETAYADGQVRIKEQSPGRTRSGSAEHAEYYVSGAKAVLYGGAPQFEDSIRGVSRGERITWYQESDKLLVEGSQGQPANSKIRRK